MGVTAGLALLNVASAGFQAYGQYQEAKSQAAAENYNAAVLRQQADQSKKAAQLEADRTRRNALLLRGTQKSLYSKAGVALSGSSLEVINDSAAEAELDALIIEYNGNIAAQNAESEANQRDALAKRIKAQGLFNAGTTLLTQTANYAVDNFGTKTTSLSEQSRIIGRDTRQFRNTGRPGQQPSFRR